MLDIKKLDKKFTEILSEYDESKLEQWLEFDKNRTKNETKIMNELQEKVKRQLIRDYKYNFNSDFFKQPEIIDMIKEIVLTTEKVIKGVK